MKVFDTTSWGFIVASNSIHPSTPTSTWMRGACFLPVTHEDMSESFKESGRGEKQKQNGIRKVWEAKFPSTSFIFARLTFDILERRKTETKCLLIFVVEFDVREIMRL